MLMHAFTRRLFITSAIAAPLSSPAFAQGVTSTNRVTHSLPADASSGNKHAFIICGHPGDQEHRELYAQSITSLRRSLVDRFAFPEENVWHRFGIDEADEGNPQSSRGPATQEALADDVEQLKTRIEANDELWVFVLGHAHPLVRNAQLNLPGPDVTAEEFAQWFGDLECRRSVFFITTPLSGFFLKPLARPGRVVISATESDFEVNETMFHSSLAKIMESFPSGAEHDVDKDGVYSLLDLYLAVALDVAALYTAEDLLATEHAQLEDNGDGRGSELQLGYIDDEGADSPRPRAARWRPERDGALARSIDLGAVVQREPNPPAGP